MDVYPVFLKLQGRSGLVVGGGEVAARKAELLLRAGARLTVIAPALAPELAVWAREGRLRHRSSPFVPDDLIGQSLVIIATGDEDLAARAAAAARAAGIPVNVVDRPALSTFISGALVDRSPVLVAISTGGAAPVLARKIRVAIEQLLHPALGRLARFAERFRAPAQAAIRGTSARRRFWEDFFDGPVARQVLLGNERQAQAAMLALVNRPDVSHDTGGIVHLVGAGPGDPDLLTLRAVRVLSEADVIVHDSLVHPAILDQARRDATRIAVGKRKGRHSWNQHEINQLLVHLARQGKRVARLKGGDPFIFGRGGEELAYLREHGVAIEVVPGVSAALGCAAAAQIPLTHRALSSTLTLVSGHGAAGEIALDWSALGRNSGTLAVYMGVSVATEFSRELMAHGRAPSTPAAIIENGTRPNERIFVGTLAELGKLVDRHGIEGPALIVVGEVAAFAKADMAHALPVVVNA